MVYRVYVLDRIGKRHLVDKVFEKTLVDGLVQSAWRLESKKVDSVEVTIAADGAKAESVLYRGDRTADGSIVSVPNLGYVRPIMDE